MQNQGVIYNVDIVLCIDATASMTPHINRVRQNALTLYADISQSLAKMDKHINLLRVRGIAFRDYYCDPDPMIISPWYQMPEAAKEFEKFINGIQALGGGDDPESCLEALSLAIQSDWSKEGEKRRQIIVIFSDAMPHPLEKSPKPSNYPVNIPKNFNELTNLWQGQGSPLDPTFKRLIVFAPESEIWSVCDENWQFFLHHTAQAGNGLAATDYEFILTQIAKSC